MKFGQLMEMEYPKVDLEGRGHRSKVKVTRSKSVIFQTRKKIYHEKYCT